MIPANPSSEYGRGSFGGVAPVGLGTPGPPRGTSRLRGAPDNERPGHGNSVTVRRRPVFGQPNHKSRGRLKAPKNRKCPHMITGSPKTLRCGPCRRRPVSSGARGKHGIQTGATSTGAGLRTSCTRPTARALRCSLGGKISSSPSNSMPRRDGKDRARPSSHGTFVAIRAKLWENRFRISSATAQA